MDTKSDDCSVSVNIVNSSLEDQQETISHIAFRVTKAPAFSISSCCSSAELRPFGGRRGNRGHLKRCPLMLALWPLSQMHSMINSLIRQTCQPSTLFMQGMKPEVTICCLVLQDSLQPSGWVKNSFLVLNSSQQNTHLAAGICVYNTLNQAKNNNKKLKASF